ncbi:unnamed protein product [Ambrosiozyma monospora]|uniref:Unnamed protein product n=1 Tax=Ambrosiozyma monospora TaxID=43982 RepID=A0ACB5TLR8_AMBMO|nr:unnamed protein product [Ambrosiozyma monospora]
MDNFAYQKHVFPFSTYQVPSSSVIPFLPSSTATPPFLHIMTVSLLKSLKITNPDKIKDLDYVAKLKTPDLLSKLLLAVYHLEQEVEQLRDQVDQYENLNQLLEGEDLSDETKDSDENENIAKKHEKESNDDESKSPSKPNSPDSETKSETENQQIVVEKLTRNKHDDSTPSGFTPMYSTPALTLDEVMTMPNKRNVIKPWPEVTLGQLAAKFKIPKELLQQSSQVISAQQKKDGAKAGRGRSATPVSSSQKTGSSSNNSTNNNTNTNTNNNNNNRSNSNSRGKSPSRSTSKSRSPSTKNSLPVSKPNVTTRSASSSIATTPTPQLTAPPPPPAPAPAPASTGRQSRNSTKRAREAEAEAQAESEPAPKTRPFVGQRFKITKLSIFFIAIDSPNSQQH